MSLHLLEFPREVTEEQLRDVFATLGLEMGRCRRVELRHDGITIEAYATDVLGRTLPALVTVDVNVAPGRAA